MKILIANPFGIGDVLFTTPLIANMKRQAPDMKIGYLCNRRVEPLLKNDNRIYKIFVYEKDELRDVWEKSKCLCLKELKHLMSDVKKENFDCVFDFSLAGEFGFFFWLAGIKKRIGFNYRDRAKFLNKKIPFSGFKDKHVVEYYLSLLKFINIAAEEKNTKAFTNKADKDKAAEFLKRNGLNAQDKIIAVSPAAGASWGRDSYRKHFPKERFAKVCDRIIRENIAKVVLLGDKKEKPILDAVVSAMHNKPAIVSSGLSLGEYISVLSYAGLLLTNDGGPLHIAVALGIPTVSIFGPVDEKIYGPYPPSKMHKVITSSVECRPCYKNFKLPECKNTRCLSGVSEDEVFTACAGGIKG
ncbi:MAG: glycosyltransferase family 9 protein [Candidatus Omnitrophica bacterium]|nr:glycosyltransferase family 9 protein [Candidatus Omnitrophota bacterium]